MSDGFKKIWIEIKRLYLHENQPFPESVCLVEINENEGSEEVNRKLRETFHIDDVDLVLKLRNHRKSLIPINSNITANSKSVPYKLEVVRRYQNVTPKRRTTESVAQKETVSIKKKYMELVNRELVNNPENYRRFIDSSFDEDIEDNISTSRPIQKLEASLPELDKKRHNRITVEVESLEQKLDFLSKRLNETDQVKWKGMFKKNPLW